MRGWLSIADVVLAALSVPLILRKVPPNRAYGFRTPRTLSDPKVWYPANAFSGAALLVAAGVSAAALWLLPEGAREQPLTPLATFVAPLLLSVAASFAYLRRLTRGR